MNLDGVHLVIILSLFFAVVCILLWFALSAAKERARGLEHLLRQKADEYQLLEKDHISLRSTSNEILRLGQVARIFSQLPETLSGVYGFPFVWIDLVDASGSQFEIAGGYNSEKGRGGDPLNLGFELAEKVIASNKALLWKNLGQEHPALQVMLPQHITTLLSIPLGSEKRGWGVLHLADSREHPISHATLENLKFIANVLSQAVDYIRVGDKLRVAESERRAMDAMLSDARVTINSRGLITNVNPIFEDMFGYESKQVIGKNVKIIVPEEIVADHDAYIQRYLLTGQRRTLGLTREYQARTADGRLIPVDVTIHESIIDGRQLFTGFIRDVSERKVSEQRLEEAQVLAQKADLARQNFLHNMNHALRTPLTGITGMADLLIETRLDKEQREYVQSLLASSQVLVESLDGLVAYAKMENNPGPGKSEDLDPRRLLDDLADLVSERTSDEVDVFLHLSRDLPTSLDVEISRLRQVLLHLFSYVARETQAGTVILGGGIQQTSSPFPNIHFWAETTQSLDHRNLESVLITSDYHNSSPLSMAEGCFSLQLASRLGRLMRGHFEVTQEEHGTRVSFLLKQGTTSDLQFSSNILSHVNCLILEPRDAIFNAMEGSLLAYGCRPLRASDGIVAYNMLQESVVKGGRIDTVLFSYEPDFESARSLARTIKSNALLEETRLVMHCTIGNRSQAIKLLNEGVDVCVTRPLKQKRLVELLLNVITERLTVTSKRRPAHQIHVLLVEDNEINQQLITKVLEHKGVQYRVVGDGHAAVQAFQQEHFDLILMDVNLPIMDGFEATRCIRDLETSRRHTPIAGMSADVLNVNKASCISNGMDDFLPKPLRVEELFRKLDKLLKMVDMEID